MDGKDRIKFLGTAGARFVMANQLRSSAGTFLCLNGQNIILDPGPGTLVKLASSKPKIDTGQLDAIILTHSHIDHSNDVNAVIDAMTSGGLKKRGVLFATRDSLEGDNAVVLKYLRGFLQDIVILEENQHYLLGEVGFSSSIRHQHPVETYGIKFHYHQHQISFLVDTRFFSELISDYQDSHIMIINVVLNNPFQNEKIMHLHTGDVKHLVSSIKPAKAILTHFGLAMLQAKPWVVAQRLAEETGVNVIAASDGMTLDPSLSGLISP